MMALKFVQTPFSNIVAIASCDNDNGEIDDWYTLNETGMWPNFANYNFFSFD